MPSSFVLLCWSVQIVGGCLVGRTFLFGALHVGGGGNVVVGYIPGL